MSATNSDTHETRQAENPAQSERQVESVERYRASPKLKALYAVAILLGVALITAVAMRGDGNETDQAIVSNAGLTRLIPSRGAEVPHQTDIGADLEPGYRGTLSVNGTPIPSSHLRRGDSNSLNEVITRPGMLGTDSTTGEQDLEPVLGTLPTGENCAEVAIWAEDRPESRTNVGWCFNVT